jgi:hypothetical protein
MVFVLVNLSISGALLVFGKKIQDQIQAAHLLWRGESEGRPLKVLMSITSLLFIIQRSLGLWLWIKPKIG